MVQTFEQAWDVARRVDGWLTEAQARALYDAGRALRPGTRAVEIGSHRGKSAIVIASGLPAGARLTAVDPFDDPRWGGGPESLEHFTANVDAAGVADRIDLFRGTSAEASAAWTGDPVGFLWVDGAHDLESTLIDFDTWMPHLAPGAKLYVHDAFSAIGTTQAVLRRFLWSGNVRYLGCVRTLVEFEIGPTGPTDRLVSALGLLSRLPFFGRMVAIKLARRQRMPRLVRRLAGGDAEALI